MKPHRLPNKIFRASLAPLAFMTMTAVASTAVADFTSGAGNDCDGGFFQHAFHDDLGALWNLTGATANLMCPLKWGTTSSSSKTLDSGGVVNYVDHHTTDPFWCYVTRATSGGSQYWSTTKYTCATNGGCVDATSSYMGVNYLFWSTADLGPNITTSNFDDAWNIRCAVPRATSGNNSGRSGVLSYQVY